MQSIFYKTNDFRRCTHHCEWFETKKPKLVSKNQKSPLLLIEASATEFAFDLCTAVTSVNITEDYEIDSSTSNMSNAFVHLWIFQTQFFLASIKTVVVYGLVCKESPFLIKERVRSKSLGRFAMLPWVCHPIFGQFVLHVEFRIHKLRRTNIYSYKLSTAISIFFVRV